MKPFNLWALLICQFSNFLTQEPLKIEDLKKHIPYSLMLLLSKTPISA